MAEFVLDGIQTEMNYETNKMYFVHRFTKKDDNLDFVTATMYATMEDMRLISFGNLEGYVIEECGKRLGKGENAIKLSIKKTEATEKTVNVTFEYSKPYAFILAGHVTFEKDVLDEVIYGKITEKVTDHLQELLVKK